MAFAVSWSMSSRPSGAHAVEFVTARPCPFAQRVWIALNESGVNYDLKEVDLYGSRKPPWFMKLNPSGKVPVVVVHGQDGSEPTVVTESNRICMYIAQNFCKRLLLPGPQRMEEAEDWLHWTDSVLGKHGKDRVTRGPPGPELANPSLVRCIEKLEKALETGSSFICGDNISVVDISLYPFISRLDETYDIPSIDYPHLTRYIRRMSQAESVRATKSKGWWWWW
eukprot:Plantae.Rhodophyta-Purpureofilum_apyrenoidigerum.ctg23474.p1 GENE.Plantae.Rhodophyta-Purpureofilum_apyrenoidigerum.ctg23474~~Plantae.Rhodophyta-Purpureofilum_apyrenoidigerum.ctg23474.p1  ORF type:complete len:244 (-),score=22.48 Plantae.Rhodophyta-Purpureofilum_apyrenoidigerum.ctg23474:35-706(-)